jgi:hypothetical protein
MRRTETTVTRTLASVQPPPETIRPRWVVAHVGTGLRLSDPLFQIKHDCGDWAWAHAPFCQWCGGAVKPTEAQQAVLSPPAPAREPAPAVRPAAQPGSFNSPVPREGQPAWLPPRPLPGGRAGFGFNVDPVAARAAEAALAALRPPTGPVVPGGAGPAPVPDPPSGEEAADEDEDDGVA